jgi:predicted RNA-binding protein with PIN domain
MTEPTGVPRVPESLLEPLLEAAADVLKSLDPGDVPPALRRLFEFDPRGLGRGVARQQLRHALESDTGFRERAIAEFLARPEAQDAKSRWHVDDALAIVGEAAERSDLPVLASTLVAARPEGWEFGLGVVRALHEQAVSGEEVEQEREANSVRISQLEVALAREETARATAENEAERANAALRSERQQRRSREQEAGREHAVLRRRLDEAEASQAGEREAREAADARAVREAGRAHAAEREVRGLRTQLAEPAPVAPPVPARADDPPATVGDAAALARRLASGLDALSSPLRSPAPAPSPPPSTPAPAARPQPVAAPPAPPASSVPSTPAPASPSAANPSSVPRRQGPRLAPPLPPGMRADTPEGLDAMLRYRGVVLIVDGYNVSMRAWPHVSVEQQRQLLSSALAELHARLRCTVTVVFDGTDVDGGQLPRRPGVRVVFSTGGEKADPVIVREVRALPDRFPVVVVSSDHWVRDHSAEAGAQVVPTETLLRVLRVGATG